MTFSELEKTLGFVLPKSAYAYKAWWANGGHSQAQAWLNAGYKVKRADWQTQTVCFYRSGSISKQKSQTHRKEHRTTVSTGPMPLNLSAKAMTICGYEFRYLQQLMPECDANGKIIKYYPQSEYDNKKNLPLSYHGKGPFCRFSIKAGEWPGVYLWVVDNNIIYIGETDGLQRRFNAGYGRIAPRNCYLGGQSTNCKMNKVVLSFYVQGKTVSLNGLALRNYAAGTDTSRVMTDGWEAPIKSVGHGVTCVSDLLDDEEVWRVILELSQDVGHRLRINGLLAKGVQITLRDNDLFYKQYQNTLEVATRSPKEIAEQCFALFKTNYRWQNKVRALCVRAISLVPEKCPEQLTIFDDPVKREKQDKLEGAIEDIRRRFGKRAVYNACLMGDIKVHEIGAQNVTMPGMMYA